jgi:membrane-associated phospholipid phosphatase
MGGDLLTLCSPDWSLLSWVWTELSSLTKQLMIAYSNVPIVVFLTALVLLLTKRTTPPLLVIVLFLAIASTNEALLKNIIAQPRPDNSCASSYGMPSGHSIVSLALLTWSLFELASDHWPLALRTRLALAASAVAAFVPVLPSRMSAAPLVE